MESPGHSPGFFCAPKPLPEVSHLTIKFILREEVVEMMSHKKMIAVLSVSSETADRFTFKRDGKPDVSGNINEKGEFYSLEVSD